MTKFTPDQRSKLANIDVSFVYWSNHEVSQMYISKIANT